MVPAIASADDDGFRRPGVPAIPDLPPEPAPNPGAIAPPDPDLKYETVPIPDRNRIIDALGVLDNPGNPYQQSTLKGDRPVFDDWFFELSVISDTSLEPRSVPTPTSGVATAHLQDNDSFGHPRQIGFNQNVIPSIRITKGDTAFMPPELEFRFTPAINYNFTQVEEVGVLNANPATGRVRNDSFVGIQEASIDYHIRNVSSRYDFDSIRVGVQPINFDFRGFLFQDDQLGVRLFGDRANNRFQYNIAYFKRAQKDTNSGLNDFSKDLRRDNIVYTSLFVQDLPVRGFTTEFSYINNWNNETGQYNDTNGFQITPAQFGLESPRKYNVDYFGLNGDGHFGRLNLTYSSYLALGTDDNNQFAAKLGQDPLAQQAHIRAFFAAAEPSIDFDWIRIRASMLYASGQKNAYSHTETGFDSIQENPQFAGADTSYFIRQGIPFIGGGGIALTGPNAILPDLRSSKDQGQSNFINPGITLLGVGADFDVLPELRISANANHLNFNDPTVLQTYLNGNYVHHEIGWDLSSAVTYRPFETQNVILRLSGAVLLPGQGFKDIYSTATTDHYYYSFLTNLILAY